MWVAARVPPRPLPARAAAGHASRAAAARVARAAPPLTRRACVCPRAAVDQNGSLPLHYAAIYKVNEAVVRLLLEAYPEAKAVKSKYGELPKDLAKKVGASAAVNALLR